MAKVSKSPLQRRIDMLVREHGGLRAAARMLGMDAAYLGRLRSGEKTQPSARTLENLGLERIEMIRPVRESVSA